MLSASAGPMVAADFQSILAALMLLERLPNGRFPERQIMQQAWLIPLVEAVRQTVVSFARERGIDVLLTNSDGSPSRRAHLLERLGPMASEQIVDPGFNIITERLSDPNGRISEQCVEARDRWYSRRA